MRTSRRIAALAALLVVASTIVVGSARAQDPAEDRAEDVKRIYYEEWNWVTYQGHCSWDTLRTVSHDANQHPGTLYDDGQRTTDDTFSLVNNSTFGAATTAVDTLAFLYGPGTDALAEDANRTVQWTNCFAIKSFVIPVLNSFVWTNDPVSCYARNTTGCGFDHTEGCAQPWLFYPGNLALWLVGEPFPAVPPTDCFVPPGELNCTSDMLACIPTEWCYPPDLIIPDPREN